jgi:predicted RNase H-like HicB family nuclease
MTINIRFETKNKLFWIDIEEVPGCVSNAENIENVTSNYREALDLHFEEDKSNELYSEAKEAINELEFNLIR